MVKDHSILLASRCYSQRSKEGGPALMVSGKPARNRAIFWELPARRLLAT